MELNRCSKTLGKRCHSRSPRDWDTRAHLEVEFSKKRGHCSCERGHRRVSRRNGDARAPPGPFPYGTSRRGPRFDVCYEALVLRFALAGLGLGVDAKLLLLLGKRESMLRCDFLATRDFYDATIRGRTRRRRARDRGRSPSSPRERRPPTTIGSDRSSSEWVLTWGTRLARSESPGRARPRPSTATVRATS